MADLSSMQAARLFTTFGTVLYIDPASGELRHGPMETSPANAFLAPQASSLTPCRFGRLMCEREGSWDPIAVSADDCRVVPSANDDDGSTVEMALEIVPLERGLIGLRCGDGFLGAVPDGRVDGSKQLCSIWECFLASEDWCAAGSVSADDSVEGAIDKKAIAKFIVDPRLRAKANAKSSATKVLAYGYPQWSHGRVYYDLSIHLHRRGYIVDLLNWQLDHAEYIHELIEFYDLILSAPDGVGTLVDVYNVPYEKIIAVSHHEMDIRMLIEQKGIEVFDKFANYGAVSYSVYCSSMMQGIRRPPMVVPNGINFEEFAVEPPKRLETVGYATSMSVTTYGVEWKRGHLAEAAAREAGLDFIVAGSTGDQTSFHDMPDFYRTVGAVLSSSISEAASLQVMEAAAAGRLVIGTPVGHFPVQAYQGGGIIAPIEAEKFVAFTAATLRHYKEHPAEYLARCRAIQEAAKQFDWQYSIGAWADLIDSARPHSRRSIGMAASITDGSVGLAEALKLRQLPELELRGVRSAHCQVAPAPQGESYPGVSGGIRSETTLVEQIEWAPVHGATTRVDDDGLVVLRDGRTMDWHLLRWTDSRLNGARVRLRIVAKPSNECDTSLYVHHWGDKDVCSIDKNGAVVLSEGAEDIRVDHLSDGFLATTIVFENRHPTLSVGTGKPRGRYVGTGKDQYLFRSIQVELLPLNPVRKVLIDRLWRGSDPFFGLPSNLFKYDLQGWNSQHSYLSETIDRLRPRVIVEVGVWKGGGTVFMANELKKHELSSVVIAVDTWLGSSEHWVGASNADLSFLNGGAQLYHKFLSNVINSDVAAYVVPLPMDSLNAAETLRMLDVKPSMIHLDGGHDYESVMADLRVWWPVLAPSGVLVGDDYFTDGMWPTVRKAFDDFFCPLDLTPIENVAGKCRVQKPS